MKKVKILLLTIGLVLTILIIHNLFIYKRVNIAILYNDPYTEKEIDALLKIINEDVNNYCKSINSNYRFIFTSKFVENIPESITEAIKECLALKISYIVGLDYTYDCLEAIKLTSGMDFIFISPYASSDDGCVVDNLFRLRCIDSNQGKIQAQYAMSLNITKIILCYLDVSWGKNIAREFEGEYTRNGGYLIKKTSYTTDRLSELMYGLNDTVGKNIDELDNIGIYQIGIMETKDIMNKLNDFIILQNVTWFGSDAISSKLLDPIFKEMNLQTDFNKIRFFALSQAPEYSHKYNCTNEEYKKNNLGELDFIQAARYDACWIYVKSILNCSSSDPKIVLETIPVIANNYYGLTGLCCLNEYGDRRQCNYDVIQFIIEDKHIIQKKIAYYNSNINKFIHLNQFYE